MYCRKCGKEIDYDSPFCKGCEEKFLNMTDEKPFKVILAQEEQAKGEQQPLQGSRMDGFKKALTAAILGEVSVILFIFLAPFSMVLLETSMLFFDGTLMGALISILFGFLAVGVLLANIPAIFAIKYGIQSIKCFINAVREKRVKPIATLICGIVGVVWSAETLMLTLSVMMIYLLLFSVFAVVVLAAIALLI